MTVCPFCHTAIDAGTAEVAAAKMSRINQACSDANYLRFAVGLYAAYIAVRCIPAYVAYRSGGRFYSCLALAAPFMTIRWWVKFGSLQTDDAEFRSAKRSAVYITIAAVATFVVGAVGILFF
jgi:hypothetical protein